MKDKTGLGEKLLLGYLGLTGIGSLAGRLLEAKLGADIVRMIAEEEIRRDGILFERQLAQQEVLRARLAEREAEEQGKQQIQLAEAEAVQAKRKERLRKRKKRRQELLRIRIAQLEKRAK